jgi:hypothetical protein
VINEKENAVLLIAGFTQREISDRKRKFYNLFRIEPWLVPMRKHGEWGGLTTQEILDIVDEHTEIPNAIPMLYRDQAADLCRAIEARLKEKNT